MIIAKQKEFSEIEQLIAPYSKILMVGCGTCMTFCSAGGPKEVDRLAQDLIAQRKGLIIEKTVIPRQCAERFIDRLKDKVQAFEVILSMGCGNGVQALSRQFPHKRVLPALNTQFIGLKKESGVWTEMCMACGDCILWKTAGICPITRCAKGLLNGPCGGSQEGRCEVSKDIPCAWQEIYQGLKRLGLLDYLKGEAEVKNWPVHPGRLVKEQINSE